MNNQQEWARVLGALAEGREGPDGDQRKQVVQDALGLAGSVTDDIVGCSVTEATPTGFHTPMASNDLALALDHAQYDPSSGPCVAACRDGRAHSITTMVAEEHYPHFTGAAEQRGVRSSLSLPLPGTRSASALNLYAQSLSAFEDPRVRDTAELLARCIARLLPDAPRPSPASEGAPGAVPEPVRQRRRLVQQALAVLVADGATSDDAFETLRRQSVSEQRSIFAVARDVLERSGR